MKVLYLANGLPHYFNLVLSRMNAEPGVEIVVVAPKGPGRNIGDGVFQTRQGIGFRLVELAEYSAGRLFESFRGLPALILRERPHVIVMPEHLLRAFVFHPGLRLAVALSGARTILKSIPFRTPDYASERARVGVLPRLSWKALRARIGLGLRRHCFRRVAAHVNYVDAGRELYRGWGVPAERIFVTRNSPDTDAMRRTEDALLAGPDAPRRAPYRILHVGRLVADKRVDLLIDAFARVRERIAQAELWIVGDGPERASYESRAALAGAAGSMRFVGAVYDPAELGRHFLSAAVFALPGLGGLSINEAMFYGLPVVCSSGDGTELHLVREGYNGAFFRENDAESMAQALIRILSDQEERARMGVRSREIIDREVNIRTVVAEYMKAFRFAAARVA
jgi:glycosyltransferase involved in cell wall biosynthesis